ncbi:MAG: sigma-70 family RNA polymerase sigma factor [Thermoguttaceae bacterium]|nr:sigma-70 family RNA polymerase sigma factor [Thermoguttaceae bacterium]
MVLNSRRSHPLSSSSDKRDSSGVLSPLEIYLREINNTPLLSSSEETRLAIEIGRGSQEARDQMIRANLRLVVNIARGYSGKGLSLQDLIEEGNLGLLRAVEGFDPSIGTRFSTYASYWIKQSIKRALINSSKVIRIPAYMVEIISKWHRTTNRLAEELGRAPSSEEVLKALGLSKKKLPIIKRAIHVYGLTPQVDQTDSGWSLSEMVMDERNQSPEEAIVASDNLKFVMEQLELMDSREAAVLKLRYGIGGQPPQTLKEVGQTLGLTRERVRQIETEALNRLAEALDGVPIQNRQVEDDEE